MRQVFLDRGTVVIKEVCQPLLDDHSVLVSVHYSYISSGLEVAVINAAKKDTSISRKIEKVISSISARGIEGDAVLIKGRLKGELEALGYSCSGHVITVGKKVRDFRTGDYVACAGLGFANHADIVCVPENLVVHIHKRDLLKDASLTTLGATALQGLRRAYLQIGECVCVWGLGLIGQLTVQLAKCSGCRVIGVDILDDRLKLALQSGADSVYNAADGTIVRDVIFCAGSDGVDATIITAASKTDPVVHQAIQATRKKGKIIVIGDVTMDIERSQLYNKEIDILVSCSYGPGRHDELYEKQGLDYPYAYVRWTENRNMQAFVDLMERGRLNLALLTASEVPLERITYAYEQILGKRQIGFVISYGPQPVTAGERKKAPSALGPGAFVPARRGGITSVGIIGVGNFALTTLVPVLSKLADVKIRAVVDADVTRCLFVSKMCGTAKALADDGQMIDDELVDVVVVSSAHKFHSRQALAALERGKAVLVEKPMAVARDELDAFRTFFARCPHAPLCVNYSRSFSPFIKKVKAALVGRLSPLMVHYRVNAGYPPKDLHAHTHAGAGRILGDACHVVDIVCTLIESAPVAVSVESLNSPRDTLFPTDNFSAQIRFADGSIGSIFYTAIGHPHLGKERMELFFDSKSIVMHDYTRLIGHGLPSSFNATTAVPDDGHTELITTFFDGVKKLPFAPLVSPDHLLKVAEITLLIDELACEGGGNREVP